MSDERTCHLCKGELREADRLLVIEMGKVLCGRCARTFLAESQISKLIVTAELGILGRP